MGDCLEKTDTISNLRDLCQAKLQKFLVMLKTPVSTKSLKLSNNGPAHELAGWQRTAGTVSNVYIYHDLYLLECDTIF